MSAYFSEKIIRDFTVSHLQGKNGVYVIINLKKGSGIYTQV